MLDDKDIRCNLINYLKLNHIHDVKEDIIVSELALLKERSRADVVVMNGVFHCFEIKSDCDSLNRLVKQTKAYEKYFDKISVVCTDKYLNKVIGMLPEHIGILLAVAKGTNVIFKPLRKSIQINNDYKHFRVDFLWKDEIVNALRNAQYSESVKYKNKNTLRQMLLEAYSSSDLNKLIKFSMHQRPNWQVV